MQIQIILGCKDIYIIWSMTKNIQLKYECQKVYTKAMSMPVLISRWSISCKTFCPVEYYKLSNFVCVLWMTPFISGEYMIILYYCMTLNSVVNPWIYMMFNCNLVESLRHLLCPCLLGKLYLQWNKQFYVILPTAWPYHYL